METVWDYVGRLPMWMVSGIVGAVTVALGYGLVWLLTGKKEPSGFTRFLPIVGAAIVLSIFNGYRDRTPRDPVQGAMAFLKEQRLMQAIFKVDPDAERSLKARLQAAVAET